MPEARKRRATSGPRRVLRGVGRPPGLSDFQPRFEVLPLMRHRENDDFVLIHDIQQGVRKSDERLPANIGAKSASTFGKSLEEIHCCTDFGDELISEAIRRDVVVLKVAAKVLVGRLVKAGLHLLPSLRYFPNTSSDDIVRAVPALSSA